ncbi:VanW family protein [Actinopolymorpha sp. B11F2]|uniref:VanW family protein n=1 Tax=Actinopolymorpha sp. B11F2 TaxID=3160862 RepID=UPI0032E468B8
MYEPGGTGQAFAIPPPPERRRGRIIALAVGGVLIVVLGLYTMMVFSLGDRVPRGTTIAGVPLGGLTRAAAEARLRDQLLPRADQPIKVTAAGKSYSLKPADLGLALDVSATADAAYLARTFNPVRVVDALVGGEEAAPVLTVDHERLDKSMAALARKVDTPAKEGRITFAGGTPKASEPASGHELDQPRAADTLQREFLLTSGPIDLQTADVTPRVSAGEVKRAMRDFANPAMAAPVTVQVGDESFEATPAEIGTSLQMVAGEGGKLTPKLDGKALTKALGGKLTEVQVKPKDATIVISGGQPTIRPGKIGHTVPPDKLAAAVVRALPKSADQRLARVETVTAQPKLTTAMAEKLGVKEVVGEFSTQYPHADYRNINIGRAAELINGTLIKPGETFSLNGIVGERTEANGFAKGLVIKGGRLREELGGGVSQVATTTYNAAFFAGMEDVEHRPHGFYISRYPVGREATVYWGSLDLKWGNNTPYGVYVQAWRNLSSPSSYGGVTVRLWSTKYWTVKSETSDRYNIKQGKVIHDPKPGCVPQETGVDGFEVDVRRWIYRGDELVASELDHVKYNAEDQIICGPEPEETPPPEAAPDPPATATDETQD